MNWFKKQSIGAIRRESRRALIRDIASEVISQLEGRRGWQKFLPPVALQDTVYMTTEDGAVYAMRRDNTGMEMIIQIKR